MKEGLQSLGLKGTPSRQLYNRHHQPHQSRCYQQQSEYSEKWTRGGETGRVLIDNRENSDVGDSLCLSGAACLWQSLPPQQLQQLLHFITAQSLMRAATLRPTVETQSGEGEHRPAALKAPLQLPLQAEFSGNSKVGKRLDLNSKASFVQRMTSDGSRLQDEVAWMMKKVVTRKGHWEAHAEVPIPPSPFSVHLLLICLGPATGGAEPPPVTAAAPFRL